MAKFMVVTKFFSINIFILVVIIVYVDIVDVGGSLGMIVGGDGLDRVIVPGFMGTPCEIP